MCARIRIQLNEKLYVKDPELTHLGSKIIKESIRLIDELGFDNFTLKKLASAISSTEASIYRYFESKQKLLLYLVSWYWVILDHKISFKINNIQDPKKKLRIILSTICHFATEDPHFSDIDQDALHRLSIYESSKVYLVKEVDYLNNEGLYSEVNNVFKTITTVIEEINPNYKYSNSLVSTLIKAAHQQIFLSRHIPNLTSLNAEGEDFSELIEFLELLAISSIENG
jgi:AcrR family transcriptional regulator